MRCSEIWGYLEVELTTPNTEATTQTNKDYKGDLRPSWIFGLSCFSLAAGICAFCAAIAMGFSVPSASLSFITTIYLVSFTKVNGIEKDYTFFIVDGKEA